MSTREERNAIASAARARQLQRQRDDEAAYRDARRVISEPTPAHMTWMIGGAPNDPR